MLAQASQKLEIHIPRTFTTDRPAINFVHDEYHVSINEHSLASGLPECTSVPSLFNGPSHFRALSVPHNAPVSLNDYLTSDSPQLTLYIVSFTDATIISLVWPHIASDAMGLRDLASAWSLVLAGRESEVLPMLSSDEDPMLNAGSNSSFAESHALEKTQVKGLWLFLWGIRFVLDLLWWPRMESKTIFLPHDTVKELRNDALNSIVDGSKDDGISVGEHLPFISDGDAVTAWVSSMAVSTLLPASSPRTVGIANAFDIRSRAPSMFSVKPDQGVYIQNAVLPCWANIAAQHLAEKSGMGVAALAIRRSIELQTSEAQIHALARLTRLSLTETGIPPLFGDTSSFLLTASNWSKASIYEVFDLAPAVTSSHDVLQSSELTKQSIWVEAPNSSIGQARKGKPVYYHVHGVSSNNMLERNAFFMSATPSGDYWINGSFPSAVWKAVESKLSAQQGKG